MSVILLRFIDGRFLLIEWCRWNFIHIPLYFLRFHMYRKLRGFNRNSHFRCILPGENSAKIKDCRGIIYPEQNKHKRACRPIRILRGRTF